MMGAHASQHDTTRRQAGHRKQHKLQTHRKQQVTEPRVQWLTQLLVHLVVFAASAASRVQHETQLCRAWTLMLPITTT